MSQEDNFFNGPAAIRDDDMEEIKDEVDAELLPDDQDMVKRARLTGPMPTLLSECPVIEDGKSAH